MYEWAGTLVRLEPQDAFPERRIRRGQDVEQEQGEQNRKAYELARALANKWVLAACKKKRNCAMLEKDKRWIQFNELHLRRDPEHSPIIEVGDLIPGFKSRVSAGQAAKTLENGQAAIRVIDIKYHSARKVLVFLVQYVNANVAAPSIGDLDSGVVRHEELLDREGVAVSAHVVLSTAPRDHGTSLPRYLCVFEEVPGIGRSTLQPFIRSEFKAVAQDWTWPDDTQGFRERSYQPVADLHLLANITLGEEVSQGSIVTYIEFYKHFREDHGIDECPSVRESKQIMVLKARNQANILDQISELTRRYRRLGYDELKVRYKNRGGRQKTGAMGTSEEDIADTLLGRSQQIRTDEALAQCHERIVPSLSRQMIDALMAERG